MDTTSSVATAAPSTKRKGTRIPVVPLTLVLFVVAAAYVYVSARPLVTRLYDSVVAATSPILASTTTIDVTQRATPTPGATISTERVTITVPATETKEIRLTLRRGDEVVGIYQADQQVDFNLWLLTQPRERLIQQVQVQGEKTFAFTADQNATYLLQYTSPQTTTVSIAYAIKGP